MSQNVTKEEWKDWMEHPTTAAFMERLKAEREVAIGHLAAGLFADQPGRQAIYIGLISGLTKILNSSIEDNDD